MAARVTQQVVEVLVQPTTQRVRLTQLVVEALYPADLPPAPTGPLTQRWTGSAWTTGVVQRWDGGAWVPATVKRWDGTGWV